MINSLNHWAVFSLMSDFQVLSIRQLKQVLNAKCQQLPCTEAIHIRNHMSKIAEKADLVSLCQTHVASSDIEELLKTPVDNVSSGAASSAKPAEYSSQNTHHDASANNQPKFSASQYRSQVANQMGSPDQLRYQAACMRRDPASFRRSSPEAAGFSDAQILSMAANLEQMAADPGKMKAYQEQISKMSDDDIERMQRMQQSVPPTAPGGSAAVSGIERFITALRGDPKDAKAMLKSMPGLHLSPRITLSYVHNYVNIFRFLLGLPVMSDEVYDKQLEALRSMDPATIRRLLLISETFKEYYDALDKKLGNQGIAKYVVVAVIVFCIIIVALLTWKFIAFCIGTFFGKSVDDLATYTNVDIKSDDLAQEGSMVESEFEL